MSVSRRHFILASATGLAAAAIGSRATTAYATDEALRRTAQRAVYTAGTTLAQVATPAGASGYRRLKAGPGYALKVRSELARGRSGRDDRRTATASIVQLTDLHMIDAQSPMRFEYLHNITGSAFRPQEALGSHGAAQLVQRVNDIARGPFSGRRFDCVVSTGDNTDNHEDIELDWFLAALSGGPITQNTGAPDRWEGVQTGGDKLYWNPESTLDDSYKQKGFPRIEGFFDRATKEHVSPGLKTQWYSVFGNHDDSIQGTLPSNSPGLRAVYTGRFKFTGFGDPSADRALADALGGRSTRIARQAQLRAEARYISRWIVTPDERRAPFTPVEYIRRHRSRKVTGPGPVGHGFNAEAAATGRGYYAFRIAPGVTGISLDSTNRAGFTQGSLGEEQWQWLTRTLRAASRTYWEGSTKRTHKVSDEYFVLFSHHTSTSMNSLLPDPAKPEKRRSGKELLDLLHDYPNVLAWVNGHSHDNVITPHRHEDARRSFWEINTASHVDFPQQARIIDVCDNHDGTLSLFTTLIESAAPYAASYDDGSQANLAALYRELSFNDIHTDPNRPGTPADRNTELLLADPLR